MYSRVWLPTFSVAAFRPSTPSIRIRMVDNRFIFSNFGCKDTAKFPIKQRSLIIICPGEKEITPKLLKITPKVLMITFGVIDVQIREGYVTEGTANLNKTNS